MSIENGVIVNGSPIGGEVFTFFGVGKRSDGLYYWSDVLLSSTLNPKSKHKPMEYPYDDIENIGGILYSRTTRLSDNQKRRVNYGHNMVVYNSAPAAMRGVAANTNFLYNRPSSWGRIADLWRYDHNTTNWFEIKLGATTVNQGSSTPVSILFDDLFLLGTVVEKGLSMDTANFGFIAYNSTQSSQGFPQVYFIALTDLTTPGQQLVDLQDSLELKGIPIGTWYLYPCITNVRVSQHTFTYLRDDGEYEGNWIPLPFANTITFTVVTSGAGGGVTDYINFDGGYAEYTQVDSTTYRVSSITLDFSSTATTDKVISYRLSDRQGNILSGAGNLLVSGYITVPANGSESAIIEYGEKESEYGGILVSVAMTPLEIEVEYWEQGSDSAGSGSITIG
ncbi:MAG: hypothetical protein E7110_01905 [Bacteroidales bacterium]|nr:hypothetical protein [Bacteroidales bacterium]